MRSDAQTPDEYIAQLPEDRKVAVNEVRKFIRANLPEGYEEVMNWGMISYQVPLDRYPDTYNKQPLMYAALASQKNYMAVYITAPYWDAALMQDFLNKYEASGKKLDMGKSCIRFKKVDDLALDVIAEVIRLCPVDDFIKQYERMRK